MQSFPFEDSQNAFFLIRPGSRCDFVSQQIPRQGAEKWKRSVALAAEGPILIRRIGDQAQKRFPRLDAGHFIRNVALHVWKFTLREEGSATGALSGTRSSERNVRR